jgi:hypothetical protein
LGPEPLPPLTPPTQPATEKEDSASKAVQVNFTIWLFLAFMQAFPASKILSNLAR